MLRKKKSNLELEEAREELLKSHLSRIVQFYNESNGNLEHFLSKVHAEEKAYLLSLTNNPQEGLNDRKSNGLGLADIFESFSSPIKSIWNKIVNSD